LKLASCARPEISAPGFSLRLPPRPRFHASPSARSAIALETPRPHLSAIKEIFDRIDGKPAAAAAGAGAGEPPKVVFEWKSSE
jgi:hypothetical protein